MAYGPGEKALLTQKNEITSSTSLLFHPPLILTQ